MSAVIEQTPELLACPAQDVPKLWRLVWPVLERAVSRQDEFTEQDVYEDLCNKKSQLWLAVEGSRLLGVGVTQIAVYPRKRVCLLLYVAGEGWARWRHLLDGICDWARSQGCAELEFSGRRGWLRKLPDWQFKHVTMSKRL